MMPTLNVDVQPQADCADYNGGVPNWSRGQVTDRACARRSPDQIVKQNCNSPVAWKPEAVDL